VSTADPLDDTVEADDPDGPVHLVDLTDEEVAVLAGRDGIVVLPYLNGLPAGQRDVATATAYRGLVARGMLEAPTPEQARQAERDAVSDDTASVAYPVTMPENLAHLLSLRAGADRVVCAAVSTALGQHFSYAHVVADVALLEEVTGTGLHRFSLLDADRLANRIGTWVLHPEATPGHGDEVVQLPTGGDDDPTPPDELLERLGSTLVRADVVVRQADDDGEPELVGLFSGPAGTYVSVTAFGSRAPVVIRPTTPAEVEEQLAARVRDGGPT